MVVNPKGERELVPLTQTAAGRYEAERDRLVPRSSARDGTGRAALQVIGASLDHSPEFAESRPNLARLERLAEVGGGRLLSRDFGADSPFEHDQEAFQPVDLWEWLLKFAVLLFPVDVGVRRIQIDREERSRWMAGLMRVLIFWRRKKSPKGGILATLPSATKRGRHSGASSQARQPSRPRNCSSQASRPVKTPPGRALPPPLWPSRRPLRTTRNRRATRLRAACRGQAQALRKEIECSDRLHRCRVLASGFYSSQFCPRRPVCGSMRFTTGQTNQPRGVHRVMEPWQKQSLAGWRWIAG